jgi:aryl-alcohol dehydrogenase-like predicted oxidoreductase
MLSKKQFPDLILGTGMWGQTVSKAEAFVMLDKFYDNGFRDIDTATNYPINKNTRDFRAAENILHEWINIHKVNDLRIICKFGSVNNMFTPEHNLSKSFVLMNAQEYQNKFGDNAETLMIHWDNRDNKSAIEETYEALNIAEIGGWKIGLSGIKYPEVHAEINQQNNFDFSIEIKHNPFESNYPHYAPFHSNQRRFIAYGTTGGGIKLDEKYSDSSSLILRNKLTNIKSEIIGKVKLILEKVNINQERPKIEQMYELGLINAAYHSEMKGIILGCSRLEQLENSIAFHQMLYQFDYSDVYKELTSVRD